MQCQCGGWIVKRIRRININDLKAECKSKGIKQAFGIDDRTILLHRLGRTGESIENPRMVCTGCGREQGLD